ncbi:LysR family transcriptional regulator [Pantoea sp. B65]|uniref:LysR family transcriptional regulator n=1 Tax=Pantoea sp. B65 TaxID=2813359 RepID=UPI0039B6B4B3
MALLDDMALFVEVVKVMSFRRAADATGIPNSTLSRRISALEKAIGLRLLHRTTRKIVLTEAGRLYFERCRHIVDEAKLAHEQLGEMLAQPAGVLRASFPVDFAVTWLAPLIAEFARRYPAITFDFDLTPRRVDLISEPFDVAIRIGESPDSQLITRTLARLPAFLYASPGYLASAGKPLQPADLAQHQCLTVLKTTHWKLHTPTQTSAVEVSSRFVINSVGMIRSLAIQDMGIVLLPEEVVADDLASGRLRPVLPAWQGESVPVCAVTESRLLPAKTQRFIEFLQERLER